MKRFEFLEHTADIKFRAYGKSVEEAFENSVLALISYLAGSEKISAKEKKTISINGHDYESVLYSLLDELVFLLDAEGFVASRSKISLNKFELKAEVWGDRAKNYDLDHIKAATYAEMHIKKMVPKQKNSKEYWEVQAVLDV